ncbi:PREDICTED: zinc metalloproteinase nas-4-like, partial [Wasmannia auropunctata]|uniref:zinc metalloproteinase nas-4-like n=1 Tax=Wasmannia auropunctata TaxID=64793 RepID=UPI0005F05044
MTINKEVTCCNFIYCLIMRRLLVTFTSTLFVLTIFESVGSSPYSKNIEGNYKTEPDHETGVKVAQWTKEMKVNPEELGNYFQGDIMLSNRTTRNGDANPFSRWPNRIIPYIISGQFSQDQKNMISRAMDEFHRKTCIRFVLRNGHKDFIDFQNKNIGCWSWIGRQGGGQNLNLQTP